MITFEIIHGGPKDSSVNIVLGTMLLPHSVFKLLKPTSNKLSSEAAINIANHLMNDDRCRAQKGRLSFLCAKKLEKNNGTKRPKS